MRAPRRRRSERLGGRGGGSCCGAFGGRTERSTVGEHEGSLRVRVQKMDANEPEKKKPSAAANAAGHLSNARRVDEQGAAGVLGRRAERSSVGART
jgi:hypothetical protein